ncbi:MAG: sterol desaturase family protein, partial [Rhizobiales bacterium]|nr:sterol desaturase family protein [Hyphomicrobiales bacterium]
MDDSAFGSRDKRGNWTPSQPYEYAPVFVWPVRPLRLLKWLFGFPGYFLPWNLLFAFIALGMWLYLTPDMATMRTLAPGWIAFLLLRNAALTVAWYGLFHFILYVRRSQDRSFKYNGRWPGERNDAFLFRNQTIDNLIWTFAFGIPIWTAYEVTAFY